MSSGYSSNKKGRGGKRGRPAPRRGTAKHTLQKIDVRPSKSRGQNFLIAPGALQEIIDFGRATVDDTLVEIGPGLGALTTELSRIGPVTVIEVEEKFCDELEAKFDNLTIVHADCRTVDFAELGENLTVFGNLPYSLSTDITFHIIEQRNVVKRAVFLLQKEFVQRMAAVPGTKAYGALSIGCQLHADVSLGPIIDGDCFHPPARVQSQVVHLEFYSSPRYDLSSSFWLQRIVAAAFFRRRKKIVNSIQASGSFPGIDFAGLCAEVGMSTDQRAESFTVEQFVALTNAYVAAHESGGETGAP